jgi:DNA mismatch repair protein MutL
VRDIIRLLPDSVANQIAAGEVIQRPASVVKELVENALDSGASEIVVHIKDAGKTLIQITDNGCGMSPADARMAFERHATSKITTASDLFAIRTMGFRGEALASVAAIADVEMRTKRHEDETGTYLHIQATRVIAQEPAACNNGTTIQVKNLFFNIPARRKFLKTDATELKLIISEIQRVSIPNPDICISLYHNGSALYELPASPLRKRISGLFGKSISQALVPIDTVTSVLSISGYIGLPKYARKTMGEQFFFVNRRYMRHPWFHKSVMQAYEKLLPSDSFPAYFIFLEIDPATIDINVHPTKTEIKFENDNAIWQILNAAVREALGKHNVVPSIDFDQAGSVDIPIPPRPGQSFPTPALGINPSYNPFNEPVGSPALNAQGGSTASRENLRSWESLYAGMEATSRQFESGSAPVQSTLFTDPSLGYSGKKVLQLKLKYLVLPVKSGMMVIDQKRAQERILFEKFMEVMETERVATQQILFPFTFELNPVDSALFMEILPEVTSLGFDIREFGKDTFILNGVPGVLATGTPADLIEKLLEEFKNAPLEAKSKVREQVAISLARASAAGYGVVLQPEEMDHLVDQLFACEAPNFSPDGKPVLTIIPIEDIEKHFARGV